MASILTHPNSHPYDSGLVIVDEDKSVRQWLNKEDQRPKYYDNRVNAGIHILSKKILEQEIDTPKIDLDRQLLKPLAATGKLFAYDSPEYVSDMGTPERYEKVCEDFENKIPRMKNLLNKQKAIFLDRDGIINNYVGFLRNIDDFELMDGVADAIKLINNSGYLAIVVTNQPVIARGEVAYEQLDMIHKKMETCLGKEGAFVNAVYFSPHYPDSGYVEEIGELKFDCDSRKPKPGMILQAAEDYNIELSDSWMIGDGINDIVAGMNAGCHTALVGAEKFGQEIEGNSLLEVIRKVLNGYVKCKE